MHGGELLLRHRLNGYRTVASSCFAKNDKNFPKLKQYVFVTCPGRSEIPISKTFFAGSTAIVLLFISDSFLFTRPRV